MKDSHYVPILKWKRGERVGLRNLSDEIKNKIKPMFVIVGDINPDNFGKEIVKNYGSELPFYLDFHPNLVERNPIFVDDAITKIVTDLDLNIFLIPVISLNKEDSYIKTLKKHITKFKNGICFRLGLPDFDFFREKGDSFIKTLGIPASDIDLIIDLGQLTHPLELLEDLAGITISLINTLIKIGFKSITVSGTAFPETLAGRTPNHISSIDRKELIVWDYVHKKYPNVSFGDYAADDPDEIELKTNLIIVPTIRYTHSEVWFIARGKYDPKKPRDFSQYHKLSKMLISQKDIYLGKDFSLGDLRINDCANTDCCGSGCNHGNPESWVQIATNHHITYVTRQIYSYFGS